MTYQYILIKWLAIKSFEIVDDHHKLRQLISDVYEMKLRNLAHDWTWTAACLMWGV